MAPASAEETGKLRDGLCKHSCAGTSVTSRRVPVFYGFNPMFWLQRMSNLKTCRTSVAQMPSQRCWRDNVLICRQICDSCSKYGIL